MAKIWDTLDKNTQNYIATEQAGTHQFQNFAALMQNFSHAVETTNTAINSAGSAARENEAYMEGLTAKTQAVKSAFEQLSNSVVSSNLVSGMLDLAKGFLNILNTEPGKIATQIVLLTGAMGGLSSLLSTNFIKNIGTQFVTALKLLTGQLEVTTVATNAFGAAMKLAFPTALALSAALAAIMAVGPAVKDFFDKAGYSAKDFDEEIDGLNNTLETNKQRIEEINNMSWDEKTGEILKEKEALEKENKELEKQVELEEKRKKMKALAKAAKKKTETYTTNKLLDEGGNPQQFKSHADAVAALIKEYGLLNVTAEKLEDTIVKTTHTIDDDYIGVLNSLTQELQNTHQLEDESIAIRDKNIDSIATLVEAYKDQKDSGVELTESQEALIQAYQKYQTEAADAAAWTKEYGDAVALTADDVDNIRQKFPGLIDDLKQTSDGWVLLSSTVAKTASAMISEDGRIVLSAKNRANATINALKQEIDVRAAYLKALMSTPYSSTDPDAALKAQQIGNAQKELQGLLNVQNKLGYAQKKTQQLGYYNDTVHVGGSGGGSGRSGGKSGGRSKSSSASQKKPTDEALERFKEYYKDLQHLRDMDEIDEETYLNRLRGLVDQYTKDATANKKKYGVTSKEIARNMYQYEEELLKGWEKLQEEKLEKQKREWEEMADKYQKAFSYVIDKAQEEIDALQSQKDAINKKYDDEIEAIERENSELEEQIRLQQALDALARAKQTNVMVYKDGHFQYVNDIDAVSEAQANLDNLKREDQLRKETEALEKSRDAEIAAIDVKIEYWQKMKDEWSDAVKHYSEQQDKLLAEQVLGTKLEGENWEKRLGNLESYVAEYEALMDRINNAQAGVGSGPSAGGGGGGASKGDGWHLEPGKGGGGWTKEEMDAGFPDGDYGATGKKPSGGGGHKKPNYGGYGDRDSFNNAIHQGFQQAQATGKPVHIGGGVSIDPGKIKKHATGTTSAPGGVSLVGENGPELRLLNQGDGILPNDITSNLWSWGMLTPSDLMGGLAGMVGNVSRGVQIMIDNFNPNLPNVTDGQGFADYMKNNFWRETLQFAKT